MDRPPTCERSESINACPTPPTPGGSLVPRANVTSTSGQGAADADAMRIGALSGAAQVVTNAAPSKRANWRAFTSQCSHIATATDQVPNNGADAERGGCV